ncbi:MAG TPA: hypothetical protein VNA21_16280 [Steroidobacteraceae bacterium]|nr:hypothetical protein [Steroidobacteraceae bacterium]
MDNRNNPTEDFQSTPEHLANQVGGPGFTKASDADSDITPGSLRQVMLDSEHESSVARSDGESQSSYSSINPSEMQPQSSSNAGGYTSSSYASTNMTSDATTNTWRTRMTERVRTMRTSAGQHPVALALIATGVLLGTGALMRSRSRGR